MNQYVISKFHFIMNIFVIIFVECILLIVIPSDYLIIMTLIYIIVTVLAIQYFYSWKLLIDSNAIYNHFKLFTTEYKRIHKWTDMGRVIYSEKRKKVYLYDKNNKRILTIGREIKNLKDLCIEIEKSILNKSILDNQFLDFINDIK